ncbi:MAG: hypothetical protein C0594_15390 [Marinilabiliales bacterium]|nr:MAG: hypothetical protein C0594_15390 [Marinilabiliales bacterium]
MKKIIYISICLILASCSPQKKLARLIKKHPQLERVDTLKIHDTTIINGIQIYTSISSQVFKDSINDTIVIVHENTTLSIIESHDTVWFNIDQDPDTLIKEIHVPVEKIVYINPDPNECMKYYIKENWWIILLISFAVLVFYFISRKF